jgi:hypothetical protein
VELCAVVAGAVVTLDWPVTVVGEAGAVSVVLGCMDEASSGVVLDGEAGVVIGAVGCDGAYCADAMTGANNNAAAAAVARRIFFIGVLTEKGPHARERFKRASNAVWRRAFRELETLLCSTLSTHQV